MTTLTGTGRLVRFVLRRDRVLLPVWVFWLGMIPVAQAAATAELLTGPGQLRTYAAALSTPALTALYGPVFDANLGALTATRAGFAPVVLGLASLLTVIRHTRTEEEAGRRELLAATAVGRHAQLAAALIVTVAANVTVGVLLAAGMTTQDVPVAGSIAFGLSYAVVGATFAAVGGVAAQLAEGAGAARGIALGTLGVAFLLRMTGDLAGGAGESGALSWLSPIGWGQQIRPYAGERWWVALLPVALTVVLTAAAAVLSARRDVGAGLLRPRPGPAYAAPTLDRPVALAWRLQRSAFAGWLGGFVVLGAVLGAASDGIGDLVADVPQLADVFEQIGGAARLTDAYLAAMLGLLAAMAAGYAVQATLRLRTEETAGRTDQILTTGVRRTSWVTSHLLFGVLGPAAVLLAGGLAAGATAGAVSGDLSTQTTRMLGAAAAQLPAAWLLTGIALATFGLLPRLVAAAWVALATFVFLALLGAALRLDQWMLNLSPFTHVPDLPGGPFDATPLLWLGALAAMLVGLGLVGFARRDVDTA